MIANRRVGVKLPHPSGEQGLTICDFVNIIKSIITKEALPEWMRQRPIVDVKLKITMEEISQGPKCFACDQPTVKTLVQYVCGDETIVRAEEAPGYRCPNDSLEYLARETLIEFYTQVRETLLAKGEQQTANTLTAAIANEKKLLGTSSS